MKFALVLLCAGLCGLAQSVDVSISQKQKDVLMLLSHINQPTAYKEFVKIYETYNVTVHIAEFTKPEVVYEFEEYYQYGYFLPRGEVFSVFYEKHLKQAIMLFNLFYFAKTYQTFFETAVWARNFYNEGAFLYAYSVAVVHRPDMDGVMLPPIYEIYPYYFYDVETIQQAYMYKQMHSTQYPVAHYDQQYGYTIYSNYSGYYLNLHPEQSMSYYLEDVGINSYYYYYNLYYPYWMSAKEYGFNFFNRGEQYFFFYQQLLSRYYLERISNGFGEIPYFNWDVPLETPYYPSLEYPNGLEFPSRPAFVNLHEYFYTYGQKWTTSLYGYSYSLIQDYEKRINDAIDYGFVFHGGEKISIYTPEGLNILGNLIQGNPDSPSMRYYGMIWLFASHLFGYSYQPLQQYQAVPSALEHFETALRDPVFYQLYKKVMLKFYRYFLTYKSYTAQELTYTGVKIVNVEYDKLVTYDEYFYSDLSNAVFDSQEELLQDSFRVRVGQKRMNHKPFNYKITVDSLHAAKSVVKIFLAPLYDEYDRYINISENYMNVVLMDYFVYDFQAGSNIISRSSYDSFLYAADMPSYHELYMQATSGKVSSYGYNETFFYFPHRYMLPQGSFSGTPFQFYIYIYPYVPDTVATTEFRDTYYYPYEGETQFYDKFPLTYPFDRPIQYDSMFYTLPNFYTYHTKIFHTHDINTST